MIYEFEECFFCQAVEELRGAREHEERLKGQLAELQRKEQYHIMRLSCKEHELQEMGVSVYNVLNITVAFDFTEKCIFIYSLAI